MDHRDTRVAVRLDKVERAMAGKVAKREGLTVSDWIRQQIRRAYEQQPARNPPPTPTP